MDPSNPLSISPPTVGGLPIRSTLASGLDPTDLLARAIAAYPSRNLDGWASRPPTLDVASNADPLTQLGLSQLYPDLFGQFGPSSSANGETPTAANVIPADTQLTPTSPAPPNPSPARQPFWNQTLSNGQMAAMDDTVQGPNVVYHHGSLGGSPGVFIDNPTDPNDYQSVFTPSGLDPTQSYGFSPSPEIGPSGERYYDKVVWQAGPRQAFLRVDPQGRPVKAFALDTGEARDAPVSPFEVLGPGEAKFALGGALALGKVGIPLLAKGLGAKLAVTAIGRAGEGEAASTGANGVISIGRAGYSSIEDLRDAILAKYQNLYDRHYADTVRLAQQGAIQGGHFAIGRRLDKLARMDLRSWLELEGIPEGPNEIVRINRRLPDPTGSGDYRVPDVYIPEAQTILDGSLTPKSGSTPQIGDFGRFSGRAKTTIVRPAGLGPGRAGPGSIEGSYGIIQ